MNDNKLTDAEFIAAVAKGDAAAVKAAIAAGISANTKDEHGNSALMFGCARGRTEVCRILVEAGADTGHRNKWGLGPLDWLRWTAEPDGIRRLLAS